MQKESLRHPQLKDYLEKPRLVNTLGCSDALPPRRKVSTASSYHSSRLNKAERPAYRNLRLGNFMERPQPQGELIPDMLRQYYLDTYLDSYEFDYLKNFGEVESDEEPEQSEQQSLGFVHRGM